jgi:hypothetical protein
MKHKLKQASEEWHANLVVLLIGLLHHEIAQRRTVRLLLHLDPAPINVANEVQCLQRVTWGSRECPGQVDFPHW